MTNGRRNFATGIAVLSTLLLVDNRFHNLSPFVRYPGLLLLTLFNCWWAMKFMSWLCNTKLKKEGSAEQEN